MRDERIASSIGTIRAAPERIEAMMDGLLARAGASPAAAAGKPGRRKQVVALAFAALAVCALAAVVALPRVSGPDAPEPMQTEPPMSARERIAQQAEFGPVRAIAQSEQLIERVAGALGVWDGDAVSAYRDERYVYLFYEDGTVAGLYASYLDQADFTPPQAWQVTRLTEEAAIKKAGEALEKYCENCYKHDRSVFQTTAQQTDTPDAYPQWHIVFTEYTVRSGASIRRNIITIEIDWWGNISAIGFGRRSDVPEEMLLAAEYIDKAEAVARALAELDALGYEVDLERFTVEPELFEFEARVRWSLRFEERQEADGRERIYWVTLDAADGALIDIGQGR